MIITTAHYLVLAAVLFSLAVAGIFINRKNVILLLMCIELMLLAVNFNFIAFSRMLARFDRLELAGDPVRDRRIRFRGFRSLPMCVRKK